MDEEGEGLPDLLWSTSKHIGDNSDDGEENGIEGNLIFAAY